MIRTVRVLNNVIASVRNQKGPSPIVGTMMVSILDDRARSRGPEGLAPGHRDHCNRLWRPGVPSTPLRDAGTNLIGSTGPPFGHDLGRDNNIIVKI